MMLNVAHFHLDYPFPGRQHLEHMWTNSDGDNSGAFSKFSLIYNSS